MIFCKNKYMYFLLYVIFNSYVYFYMFMLCYDVRNVNLGYYLVLFSVCNIFFFVGSFIFDIICFLSLLIFLLIFGKKLLGNFGIFFFFSKWFVFFMDEWVFFILCFVKGVFFGLVFGWWVIFLYFGFLGVKLMLDFCFDCNIDCKRIKVI